MEKTIISTFVTENSPYEKIAEDYLIKSAKNFNISIEVIKMENFHNWNRNVAQKPLAIKKLMKQYPNKNIVMLDADATIEKPLDLFETLDKTQHDIAVHILSWELWYNRPGDPVKELLTGTMWLRNCNKVKELCDLWYHEYTRTSQWEQACLSTVIKNGNYDVYELPIEYVAIDSMPNGDAPYYKIKEPVIKHYQLSRTLKRGIL